MVDFEKGLNKYNILYPDSNDQIISREAANASPVVSYLVGNRPFFAGSWLPLVDMSGKTTLDIHAGDGAWSFAMADAGAERAVAIEPHPVAAQEIRDEIDSSKLGVELYEAAVARKTISKEIIFEGYIGSPYHADVWNKDSAAKIGGPIPSGDDVYEVESISILDVFPDPPNYIYMDAGATVPYIFESTPAEWLAEVDGIFLRWIGSRIELIRGYTLEVQAAMLQWYIAVWEQTHNVHILVASTALSLREYNKFDPPGLSWPILLTKKV